ncbi:hypothetical protein [Hufsiella ginkgonis]|uniref:Glycoside hydrolase family 65 n=1 Tax=Hufsiella ginkgonis TaxID=2695274 RepID=A0A7K1XVP5_9SPHI|nr:hypothetical protein [Hufsiella ginkgonis]MXV15063.1 hypothetical protein [Hufsiella ginkgonis]
MTCRFLYTFILSILFVNSSSAQKIDRRAVVLRHKVILSRPDTLASLTVGNGKFAFTVDVTGLQTFPEYYTHGVPLGTQSEWGWHSFPNKNNYLVSETLKDYDFNNLGPAGYAVQFKENGRNQQAVNYYRQNPHRLQLGNVGFLITKQDGSVAAPGDLREIHQELDPWTGEITSIFTVEGISVKVVTCGHAGQDVVGVKVVSALIGLKRLKVRFRFPYPTDQFADMGTNYARAADHRTKLNMISATRALFERTLDQDHYYVSGNWGQPVTAASPAPHEFVFTASNGSELDFSFGFSPVKPVAKTPVFAQVKLSSNAGWRQFWQSGGAIDLAGSTDPRANELERRIVLSEYLTRVQCAGSFPPQETGLTYNSWYGKPHMEMYWWHAAHYALWGRTALLEKGMQWYFKAYDGALAIAKRQGYKGVRWQKMTDHQGGEAPSSVGSFLIWQQPHVIYQAELVYRNNPSKTVLEKYRKLVFATADFMASFPTYDKANDRYNLGKGIIPAQECYNPGETFNSPYELAYWKWALQAAQKWRTRLGLAKEPAWQKVIDKLAKLSVKDGLYRAAESVEDSYSPDSKFTIDHPAVLAAFASLPANNMVDPLIMRSTYETVDMTWHWDHTWGWDFPLIAMTATRLNLPEKAIDGLFKNVTTNTYLPNGHNYQTDRLTIYLPGNGGLLSAIALMCAGSDDNKTRTPGFPKNGKWKVKWEGLKPMP